ncbi:hypothetical protein [Pacificoceanicola onchidii]|uniref:hypothetical protein n=1 Tax=Pacificoceanicola onchidii TaxID=2562685 RepID=UPI0010A46A2D|nr:hypothetical protein [Pacificoceanicola onchidii]
MSVDLSIAGLRFEGFEPGFANAAGAAFESALNAGLAEMDARDLADRSLGLLVLDGLDYRTPERLGQSLAKALLREVFR